MALVSIQAALITPREQQVNFSPLKARPPLVDKLNLIGLLLVICLATTSVVLNVFRMRLQGSGLVAAGFVVFSGGSLLVGQWSAHPPRHFLPTLAVPAVGCALLTAPGLTFERVLWHARWILRLLIFGSILAAVGWSDWAFSSYAQLQDRNLFGIPQMFGLTDQGNALGAAAAVAVVLEVACSKRRLSSYFVVYSSTIVLVLTQSRIAILGALLGVLLLKVERARLARITLVGLTVLGGLTGLAFPSILDNLQTSYASSDLKDVNGRKKIWEISVREFQDNPITGYGPDIFGPEYRESRLPPELQHAGQGHNQVIHTLGSLGLLGLLVLIIYVWILGVIAFRARRVAEGLPLALVAVLVTKGLTDVPLIDRGPGLVSALHLVTLLVVYTSVSEHPFASPRYIPERGVPSATGGAEGGGRIVAGCSGALISAHDRTLTRRVRCAAQLKG